MKTMRIFTFILIGILPLMSFTDKTERYGFITIKSLNYDKVFVSEMIVHREWDKYDVENECYGVTPQHFFSTAGKRFMKFVEKEYTQMMMPQNALVVTSDRQGAFFTYDQAKKGLENWENEQREQGLVIIKVRSRHFSFSCKDMQ